MLEENPLSIAPSENTVVRYMQSMAILIRAAVLYVHMHELF